MCDVTEPIHNAFTTMTAGLPFESMFDRGDLIPITAIAVGAIIAVVGIVSSALRSVAVTRARETTRRELAAYVAEGTLDPDKAVAMLEAGRPHWEKGKSGGCC